MGVFMYDKTGLDYTQLVFDDVVTIGMEKDETRGCRLLLTVCCCSRTKGLDVSTPTGVNDIHNCQRHLIRRCSDGARLPGENVEIISGQSSGHMSQWGPLLEPQTLREHH